MNPVAETAGVPRLAARALPLSPLQTPLGTLGLPLLRPVLEKIRLNGGTLRLTGVLDAVLAAQAPTDEPLLQVTVQLHRPQALTALLMGGVLGFAESYLQGDWDCAQLTDLVQLMARNRTVLDQLNRSWPARASGGVLRAWHARRRNSRSGSRANIQEHYDLSNDFFGLWLDEHWMYSSAVFTHPAQSLQEASTHKLALICTKLALCATDHVVEIGSGWGGFALYAARTTGCRVTTITISAAQYQLARQRVQAAGLQDRIEVLLCDYRDLTGQYDKLVSIEMVEAVGADYLPEYFARCKALLKPNGRALIQAITLEDTRYAQALQTVDFIKRYVFPGSFIPCNSVLVTAAARAGLKLVGLQDIGDSYALTLQHWRERFEAVLPQVQALGFDERFIRLWRFYLSYCEGGFREGVISDVQLLLDARMPAGTVQP